ncbi:MAG: nuclear transport factor 2 family protein [Acidimicrobiales bacterium]
MPEHPNITLAHQGYDAFARSDLDGLLDLLADNIVWHVGGDGPLSGARMGKDAVTELLVKVFELTGGSQRLKLLDLFANDDTVVALVHETATRARDGATLDVREAHVHRIDGDGKVVEFRDLPADPAPHDRFFS